MKPNPFPTWRRTFVLSRLIHRHPWLADTEHPGAIAHRSFTEGV